MLLSVKHLIPRFDVNGSETRFCDWLILLQIFNALIVRRQLSFERFCMQPPDYPDTAVSSGDLFYSTVVCDKDAACTTRPVFYNT
jgi:hypothetical protein